MEANPLFAAAFNVDDTRLVEFEEWYRTKHVPDGLSIPHFTRLLRYEKYPREMPLLESGPRFLNIYVIDSAESVETAWMSKEREAASEDFLRWGDALSAGTQGIYLPTAVVERKERTKWQIK
jgi:hypothetical protein